MGPRKKNIEFFDFIHSFFFISDFISLFLFLASKRIVSIETEIKNEEKKLKNFSSNKSFFISFFLWNTSVSDPLCLIRFDSSLLGNKWFNGIWLLQWNNDGWEIERVNFDLIHFDCTINSVLINGSSKLEPGFVSYIYNKDEREKKSRQTNK